MPNNIFEQIKKVNEYGQEVWSARDLMSPLGYIEWQKKLVKIAGKILMTILSAPTKWF